MERRTRQSRARLRRRGAVLIEFVIALPALLLPYLCFLQMAQAFTAGLVMRHATMTVARYASVAYPAKFIPAANHANGQTANSPSWPEAAAEALGPWKNVVRVKGADVSFAGNDPWGDVRVKVDYEYTCHIAIGRLIVCKDGVLSRTIRVVSPLQGATYSL